MNEEQIKLLMHKIEVVNQALTNLTKDAGNQIARLYVILEQLGMNMKVLHDRLEVLERQRRILPYSDSSDDIINSTLPPRKRGRKTGVEL